MSTLFGAEKRVRSSSMWLLTPIFRGTQDSDRERECYATAIQASSSTTDNYKTHPARLATNVSQRASAWSICIPTNIDRLQHQRARHRSPKQLSGASWQARLLLVLGQKVVFHQVHQATCLADLPCWPQLSFPACVYERVICTRAGLRSMSHRHSWLRRS